MRYIKSKSVILFLSTFFIAASSFFTACDNFMNAGDIRKEIEEAIAEANAQKINILISADEGTGTTIPLGSYEAKLGYSFQLSFSENSKYSFVKWQAVNQDDSSIIITDGVQFEDETQPKTKVTITTKEKIRIIPLCVERIAVQGEPSPMYERNPDGVSRDRSILVRFTKKVSPQSFIFSEEEIAKLPENAVLNKSQFKGNEVVTSYIIPKEDGTGGITYFKNVTITDEYGLSMADHFMAPSIEDSMLTIAVNRQNPIDFALNETKKIINVTLSGNITDAEKNIPMVFDQSWKYAVTEETDEKAYIEFKADRGTVSISSLRSYNIGTKIGISYKEDDPAYQFIKWDYDETILDVEDPNQKEVIFLVKEKTNTAGITVKAISAARPVVLSYAPFTNAVNNVFPKDSEIEITFNNPLPQDSEGLAQLQSIAIGIGGNNIKSYFGSPRIEGQKVIFTPKEIIPVSKGDTKIVTVSIPAQFYTLFEGTKVTYGGDGYSFDYIINASSEHKTRITFSADENSGTFMPGRGTYSYSLGEEVNLDLNLKSDYEFLGWIVKKDGVDVPDSKIKIEDSKSTSTKMIIKEELTNVTVEAQTKHLFKVMSITPENSYNGVNCDTQIVITFSKPVDSNTISLADENSDGSIMITDPYNIYVDYGKYFEEPECVGNIVTIRPKATIRELLETEYSMKNLMVSVISKKNAEIKDTDNPANNLEEANTASVYRINYAMETDPPEIDFFGVYREECDNYQLTGDYEQLTEDPLFNEDDKIIWNINEDTNDFGNFAKNRVSDKIYFSYSAEDSGSGFKHLLIKETFLGGALEVKDNVSNDNVIRYNEKAYEDSYASYESYTLQSASDGMVQLDFIFEDMAGNPTTKTVYVLKDTTIADITFSPDECQALPVAPLTLHKEGYPQYDINVRKFENDSDVEEYMIAPNTTIIDQTLTFTYSKVNDSTSLVYDSSKPHYKVEYGYSEDSLEEIINGEQECEIHDEKDYISYKFKRDITKICFVKITATDIIGNTRSVMRIFPCQINIVGDQATRPDGYPWVNNDSLGHYEILNISKTEDFASLQNKYPGFDIQYYTFFPSSYLPDSQDTYRVYSYSENGYFDKARFYRDLRNSSGELINDETFTPSGSYEIFVLPFFKYGDDFYYGTVAHGYYYHDMQISTIGAPTLPTANNQFTCILGRKIPSLGYYDVEIQWNGFNPSNESEYGVVYKKIGDADYKKKYGGLNFTLPSEYKYEVHIYQQTPDGKKKESTTYQIVDLTSAETDNAPPSSRLQLFKNEYKNDRYLKHPDVNKLCLSSQMLPYDVHGLKTAQGYSPSSGMVELEYCLTPSNNGELLHLTNEDLENRALRKAVFHKDADSIILSFDDYRLNDFNKTKNDTTLTIRLTDVNGNVSVINLRASLYSTFQYSAKTNVAIKLTTSKNLQITRAYSYLSANIAASGLTDDKWVYLASAPSFYGDSSSSNSSITSDSSSWYESYKEVLNNSVFFSCRLLDRASDTYFYGYTSEVAYYCSEWEKKRVTVENGTVPDALDGVCNSKSIIPGLGEGYQVFYDAPCFAHTMIYPTNQLSYLTEAKKDHPYVLGEDYQVWESLGSEYGVKVLNSSFAPGTATYYAPVDEIPDGYSYVTIVHFADRTAVMSEVKQK